jgi:hypothetical protein
MRCTSQLRGARCRCRASQNRRVPPHWTASTVALMAASNSVAAGAAKSSRPQGIGASSPSPAWCISCPPAKERPQLPRVWRTRSSSPLPWIRTTQRPTRSPPTGLSATAKATPGKCRRLGVCSSGGGFAAGWDVEQPTPPLAAAEAPAPIADAAREEGKRCLYLVGALHESTAANA